MKLQSLGSIVSSGILKDIKLSDFYVETIFIVANISLIIFTLIQAVFFTKFRKALKRKYTSTSNNRITIATIDYRDSMKLEPFTSQITT